MTTTATLRLLTFANAKDSLFRYLAQVTVPLPVLRVPRDELRAGVAQAVSDLPVGQADLAGITRPSVPEHVSGHALARARIGAQTLQDTPQRLGKSIRRPGA